MAVCSSGTGQRAACLLRCAAAAPPVAAMLSSALLSQAITCDRRPSPRTPLPPLLPPAPASPVFILTHVNMRCCFLSSLMRDTREGGASCRGHHQVLGEPGQVDQRSKLHLCPRQESGPVWGPSAQQLRGLASWTGRPGKLLIRPLSTSPGGPTLRRHRCPRRSAPEKC